MKKDFCAITLIFLTFFTPPLQAAVTKEVIFTLSVTIPAMIQIPMEGVSDLQNMNTVDPNQFPLTDFTEEQTIRNHEPIILQSITSK